jgi:CHAT domain-containing protein
MNSFVTVGKNGNTPMRYRLKFLDELTEPIPAKLVFFNACNLAVRNPDQTWDFVKGFQEKGIRQIVAVEAPVSSQVAELFAETFYTDFLQGSRFIGDSLHYAKRHLINAMISNNAPPKNLMALFYALYGNYGLQVLNEG